MIEDKIKFKLYSYNQIIDYFKKKNLENIVLFSQARSGSTFVTENLPKLMGFSENQIFHEGYFLNRHFTYLKHFVKKHNNFFLNVNEFVYQRTNLIKKKTLYIYLYRHSDEIQKSYNKAITKNYYFGWNEFYSRYKILFPVIGFPGTFPGLGDKPFTAVEQHVTAYPITLPTTLSTGHGGFCNYDCGFGFGLDSYLYGFQIDPARAAGYNRVPFISQAKYDSDGSFSAPGSSTVHVPFSSAGYAGVYESNPNIGLFSFSTKPAHIGREIKDFIESPYEGGVGGYPQFIPFFYKFKITAYRSFSVRSVDSDSVKATAALAESGVHSWKFNTNVFQITGNSSETPDSTIAAETGVRADDHFVKEYYGKQAHMEYPYVPADSAPTVITDSIAEMEMALFTANVDSSYKTAYKDNLGKRYISQITNMTLPQIWINARVNYISATLTATEIVETPKEFRVKKQISPDIHKRNYSTFNDSGEDTTSTSTYSGGITTGAGSTAGSSY